jgi:hypothetical protein
MLKLKIDNTLSIPDTIDSYKDCILYTNEIIRKIKLMNNEVVLAGNESFQPAFESIINSIGNILGHIKNLFRVNIFKLFSKLKRSEYRYFYDSNASSIKAILRLPYEQLIDIPCYIPEILSSSYNEATLLCINFLNYLDIVSKLKAIDANAENILRSMKDTNGQNLLAIHTPINLSISEISSSFKKYNQVWKGSSTSQKRDFRVLFKKTTALKETHEAFLNAEEHFLTVACVEKYIDKLENQVQDFVHSYERNEIQIADKRILLNMSNYCKDIAYICDYYSTTMLDLSRLEHNFILNMKKIRSKTNL